MARFGKRLEMHVCPKPLKALDQAGVSVPKKALDPWWFQFCLLSASVSGSKGESLKSWIGKVYKILTHPCHQIALSKQRFDEVNRNAAAQTIWNAFSITAPHLSNKGEKFLAQGVWGFNDS